MLRGPTLAVPQVLEQPQGRTTLVTQAWEGALSGPTLAVYQVLTQLVQRSGHALAALQARVRTKDFPVDKDFLVGIKDCPVDLWVDLKDFLDKAFSDMVVVCKGDFLKDSLELLLLQLLRTSIQVQTPVLDKLEFQEQVEAKLTEASSAPLQVRAKLDLQEQVQVTAMEELLECQTIQPSITAPFPPADFTLGFPLQRLLQTLSRT